LFVKIGGYVELTVLERHVASKLQRIGDNGPNMIAAQGVKSYAYVKELLKLTGSWASVPPECLRGRHLSLAATTGGTPLFTQDFDPPGLQSIVRRLALLRIDFELNQATAPHAHDPLKRGIVISRIWFGLTRLAE
jgi:hypothetical protein